MVRDYSMISQHIVECRVFCDDRVVCRLRYDVGSMSLYAERFSVFISFQVFEDEIHRFLEFMNSVHWRDAVNHSIRSRKFDLFDDLTNEVY